jgi:hypothetical protein
VASEDGRFASLNYSSCYFIRTGIGLFAPQYGPRRSNFIRVSKNI